MLQRGPVERRRPAGAGPDQVENESLCADIFDGDPAGARRDRGGMYGAETHPHRQR